MLRRITLENFMSHARTVIELADGLTVLVGPNNCGKSAVVEALRVLCTNPGGDFMVRHGTREAKVTVETEDGHTLVWRRKGSTVSYVIDGREVHRLGRGGVPDDLHALLRLPRVQTQQGNEFDVHFGMQKSPIFLIDDLAGARTADFFSAASDAERLMRMQQLHREKVRNARQRQKDLGEELDRSGKRLAALDGLDEAQRAVEAVEAEHEALRAADESLAAARRAVDAIEAQAAKRARHEAELRALAGIAAPPELADPAPLAGLVDQAARAAAAARREAARAAILRELRPAPALDDDAALGRLLKDLACADGVSRCIATAAAHLRTLASPPALDDEAALASLVDRLSRAAREAAAAEARRSALADLAEVPEPADLRPLGGLIDALDKARSAATQLALDVVEAKRELAEVEAEVERWTQRNPVCPVCGAPTDARRLLEGRHAHA